MEFVRYVRSSIERPALSSLLVLLGFVVLGLVLGSVAQIAILMFFKSSNGKLDESFMADLIEGNIDLKFNWWAMNLSVGASSFFSFIASALLYWKWIERKSFSDFSLKSVSNLPLLILGAFLIQIIFMPFSSYVATWNENIKLPEGLAALEEMMKQMEQSALDITNYLAKTTSISQLLANIIVVGVFAGIGEELIFRGILQRKLLKFFTNYHVAIWIAAFLFSAIHFQFYGFFPRMLLGALFGYLYVWTGSIWVPIAAHTFNNSLAILLFHLINIGVISPEFEKMENFPLILTIVSGLAGFVLLYFYKKRFARE